jgi:D-xylose reductase
MKKEHVALACEKILKDLNLEYLDLFMIHWPMSFPFVDIKTTYPPTFADMTDTMVPLRETWEAMEDLVKRGLVRNLGICNHKISQIRDLLSYAKVKPMVHQLEMHPYNSCET